MSIAFWIFFAFVILFSFVIIRGAPYVPSQKKYIKRALTKLYPLSAKDTLVDVGSGDGIVLRLAAKRGARAVGFELNPLLVLVSKFLCLGDPKITTRWADFWRVPLPDDTTVVYVFMVEKMSKKLEQKIQDEATRLHRDLTVIAFGIPFRQRQAEVTLDAYFLYTFRPLQGTAVSV